MTNIKLKGIELEAFRGFRDKVLFDFTSSNGAIADLVAIYAPNGFGKTSFYDAVEWGMHGTIERFDKNSVMNNAADYEGGFILKNRESLKESGTVRFWDQNNFHFSRSTKSTKKWDYLPGKLDSESTSVIKNTPEINKNRRIEILPQSRIDSFLSSKSPDEKYESLLDFWGGKDDSSFYVGVSRLLDYSNHDVEQTKKDLENLAKEIQDRSAAGEKIILFNSLVNSLNELNFNWNKIGLFTTETSASDFENSVTDINNKIAQVASQLNLAESEKERVLSLQEGFAPFLVNANLTISLPDEIKLLNAISYNFSQLKNCQIDKDNLVLQMQKSIVELGEINTIDNLKDSHAAAVREAAVLRSEREIITKDKVTKTEAKGNAEKLLKDKEIQLSELLTNEKKVIENNERLVSISVSSNNSSKRKSHSESRLTLCQKIRELRNAAATSFKAEVKILQNILSLSLDSFNTSEYNYTHFAENVSQIKSAFTELAIINKRLSELQTKYNRAGTLDENLHKIIELGRSFVADTQADTCPLCNTSQKDFETLLSLISSEKNDVLGLTQSLREIQELQSDIEGKVKNLNTQFEDFHTQVRLRSESLTKELTTINSKLLSIDSLVAYYSNIGLIAENENKILDNRYSDIVSENDLLKLTLENATDLILSLPVAIEGLKNLIKEQNEQIGAGDRRTTEIDATLEERNHRKDFLAVNGFITKYAIPLSEYLEGGCKKLIEDVSKKIQSFESQIKGKQDKIDILLKELANYNIDDTKKQIDDKSLNLKSLEEKVSLYRSQFKSLTLKEDVNIQEINTKKSDTEKLILNLKNADIKLRELQSNIEFVKQNIQIKELKRRLSEKEEQFKLINESTKNLENLKADLSDFLTKKIASVFNQEMINDIYRKIDPHPDFKRINLEPRFDDVKPKLFIRAINTEQTANIDPILYLSSAQVNILSLSIFLAKALQNKDVMVNTIFMDDPIQHLDSINVLSFIDLLRAITTDKQLDRQVVISTHDENFFNLLKKKFDPKYYNSKFIEFESYGKLKMT